MNHIKLFEEYNEEETNKPDSEEVVELDVDLTQEEEEDMLDDESEDCELEEAKDPLMVDSKDLMRIDDIVRKAAGNAYKAKALAQQMANAITDKWKALRRARASERKGQSDLADIFTKRATELGALGG